MDTLPLNKVVRLLEPGPLVLVTTAHHGRNNIMTMGFHMMVQHDPPLIAFVLGPWDYSYKALVETKECVIAIPGVDLMEKAVDIGNCSGAEVDKFKEFKLDASDAENVKAPLIKQCLANIECRVVNTDLTKKYNLFVVEAVKAWVNSERSEQRIFHHKGDGTFSVDGRTKDLKARMTKWKEITK
ncbi:flavin reductase (DIM6/NTAB) family NADH-FMN oxidoreductase RutF [Sphingobacterium allocomposti]|uniref:Flavin reductase (DIM6/NTAB) family NADH-FMN oxidoreductase RutF n=1 Tax=Sphingobacterium allocomposti TaxID=415956 RepID=A0A5S5CVV9_9SPHI|nr:flavin reductase family protein [Sphingobacterium composti Yoo et al. 2007 non Ten et al. 2007]TYP87735.1 flavin reductase (DIM6/NTAB) family NADH-FMN oxidoreductase RutF [Sphingobacterium composti Yoo et al. 2007 non Ten et al. 2007]